MDFLKWENRKTKKWIKKNVVYHKWQILGNSIGVDFEYLDPIINIMIEQGFKKGIDFVIEER